MQRFVTFVLSARKKTMNFKIILTGLLLVCLLPAFQCQKEGLLSGCYKGRLEVKGLCMNYTIKLLEGDIDTSLIQSNWTDPHTGISHQNVFALESVCNFPTEINEGDEFYFQIGNLSDQGCAVCLAFYPTPEKRLSITVKRSPCN